MSERTLTRARKPTPSTSFSSSSSSSSPKSQTLTLNMRKFLLLLSLSFLLLYLFLSSNPNPNPNPRFTISTSSNPKFPRIYVYDLPAKFTGGVVEKYAAARKSALVKYPGHQHSAEWALLEDLNRVNRAGSPVERTGDPETADLFYVPFFSSLSLIVNPIRPAEGEEGKEAAYSDEEVQVIRSLKLLERLRL